MAIREPDGFIDQIRYARELRHRPGHQRRPFTGLRWILIVFAAGVVHGLAYASGGASLFVVQVVPPIICWIMAWVALGRPDLNRIFALALVKYLLWAVGFGLGYGMAAMGVLRFGYAS